MATEKQILANRRNAARSTGPSTAAGKARSRLNAMSHGLTTAAARVTPTTSLNLLDLSHRLACIDAEAIKFLATIENASPGEREGLTAALRRLAALQRYAARCYSALRKNGKGDQNP